MKQQSAAEPEDKSSNDGGNISDHAKDTYSKWKKLFSIKAEDTFWVKAGKIAGGILALLILVALSPLILVGLLFALLAAL